ncbi:MAG: NAD(P)/FAD-dependent oxidoreductase [Promethearchaeota archaeon]
MKSTHKIHPVILIGGGPACISAAVQLIRSDIEILLITERVGGLVVNANMIENLIGFPKGIRGPQFANLITQDIDEHKIPIIYASVKSIERVSTGFKIETINSTDLQPKFFFSKELIIGTGTIPRKLQIPGEEKAFLEKKLNYEIIQMKLQEKAGRTLNNKKVGIIGSGDAAYDYALNLVKFGPKIDILQRSTHAKSLPLLQKRVNQNPNISTIHSFLADHIKIEEDLLKIYSKSSNKTNIKKYNFLLVAIGRIPNIEFLSKSLKKEYIQPTPNSNIFFIGDVKNGNLRQISIAMGDGVKIAMQLAKIMKKI